MILSLFGAHRWRDWERIDLAKSGRPIRRKMANRDRREEERMKWKWKGGFRRVFGFLGDAFVSRVRDIFRRWNLSVYIQSYRETGRPNKMSKGVQGGRGGEGE